MKDEVAKVIIGYFRLNEVDKMEVKDFIDKADKIPLNRKEEFKKSLNESLGPLSSSSCPCCGK